MKKSLIALAALAATASFAQSTVTIYGQADAAYTSIKSGANTFTGIQGAGRGSNFVGFMGTEDLGGGLKANFKLEAQYSLDSGVGSGTNTNNQASGGVATLQGATDAATLAGSPATRASLGGGQGLTFNRWSYAGLSGNFGEVRVGREYTPTFLAALGADTTGANGVQNTLFQTLYIGQANSHANATSASNGISYESPVMAGLRVKVQQFYGENAPGLVSSNVQTGKTGNGNSYAVTYANGPLSAGFGSQKTQGTSVKGVSNLQSGVGIAAIPGDYQYDTAYAKYDFGVVLLTAGTVTETLQTLGTDSTTAAGALTAAVAGELKNKTNLFGFSYPVNATLKINGTYAKSKYTVAGAAKGEGTQLGLQALYSMSKRTDLYVNYAVTDNTDTNKVYGIGNGSGRLAVVGVAGGNSTAYQIGMRHNF